jgi:hypothetical protein
MALQMHMLLALTLLLTLTLATSSSSSSPSNTAKRYCGWELMQDYGMFFLLPFLLHLIPPSHPQVFPLLPSLPSLFSL